MRSSLNIVSTGTLGPVEIMLDWLPQGVKSRLRKYYYDTKSTYYRYRHPFTAADLLSTLRELGISDGDVVLVHSSFAEFLGFRGKAPDVIRVLKQAVGPHGTLMMPTLSFSGSVVAYAREAKLFDPARSPSRVGLLTELFRRSEGVVRSLHPTHSVAVSGPDSSYLVQDHHLAATPCGRGTPYFRLLEKRGKILLLGVGISPLTFFHCVEELIEGEMPFSPFTSEVFTMRCRVDGTVLETSPMRLYNPGISGCRDLSVLEDALRKERAWHHRKLGSLKVTVLNAADILSAAKALAQQGIYCYRKARV